MKGLTLFNIVSSKILKVTIFGRADYAAKCENAAHCQNINRIKIGVLRPRKGIGDTKWLKVLKKLLPIC